MTDNAGTATSMDAEFSGLDFDFLQYIGGRREGLRDIQKFYLPRFTECHNVVDLGCGEGVFVQMLMEQGIGVTGVDSDDKARAAAEHYGLPIVQDDVFHYLRSLAPGSIDGVFCAHLVEHLPYEQVIELIRLSHQALMPGGVIVLATPDVRSLYAHLEMFYLHFGHVSFYHPRLLCFFLDHAGFTGTEFGSNPNTASPMLRELDDLELDAGLSEVNYLAEIPPQGNSLLHKASYSLKRRLTRWLVQPFLDDLTGSINWEIRRTRAEMRTLVESLQSLNGPFECYAFAYKPDAHEKKKQSHLQNA